MKGDSIEERPQFLPYSHPSLRDARPRGGFSLVKISKELATGESASACLPMVAPDPSNTDSIQLPY